jgi:P-type Cu+ transporter
VPIDPICHMQVSESSPLTAVHDGKTYWFCSEHCRRTFRARVAAGEPVDDGAGDAQASMLSILMQAPVPAQHEPPSPSPSAKNRIYYCPMDEGIEQRGFGTCPKCGMGLVPKPSADLTEQEDDSELAAMTRRFWVALILTVPVLLLSMLPMVGVPLDRWIPPAVSKWLQALLATPIVFWAGWPFLVRGVQSVRNRSLNMFTLIALGIIAAYGYSLATVLRSLAGAQTVDHTAHLQTTANGSLPAAHLYFEAAAAITVLVLFGQILELRSRKQTTGAIRELLALAPPTARRLEHDAEVEIPLAEVRPGDLLRVRPGDKVPVDGQIETGSSAVDESLISGESVPVAKGPGDRVIGGTLNQQGAFTMRAEHVGDATVLAQIVRLVALAQTSRAPIQKLADRVSGVFVPAVIAISIVTFVGWLLLGPEPRLPAALTNAVAVLIVACPCALGLATPMSVMVGIGRGAKSGVLIRNAEMIEVMQSVQVVVVDKTGTLTEGKPQVVRCMSTGGIADNELLKLAASVSRNSSHPLSQAVVEAAKTGNVLLLPAESFESVAGSGIRGIVGGRDVRVGNQAYVEDGQSRIPPKLVDEAELLRREGHTVTFVGVDGGVAGLLAARDPIRESTRPAIETLHRLGLSIVMLTGDNETTARTVAEPLGIEWFEAGVKPQDKYVRVHKLREDGNVVAMAGDGVNDAPALAEADVGIAMGSGAEVTIETADVTLLAGDLRGICRAFLLSRAVMRNIRQNLFFAFVYNLLGVPIAAGILYPAFGIVLSPVFAAAAMSFSSVSVVLNALRLRAVPLDVQ